MQLWNSNTYGIVIYYYNIDYLGTVKNSPLEIKRTRVYSEVNVHRMVLPISFVFTSFLA